MTMGYTYFDMFTSGTTRLFEWFLNLFDRKIVPKPPTSPSWYWWGPKQHTWHTRSFGMLPNGLSKVMDIPSQIEMPSSDKILEKIYISNQSSWYTTIYNILWYAGIAVVIEVHHI